MLPDQSQGACQAIEDAAALGIIFGRSYQYTNDIRSGLQLYEEVRKPRASKVQAASARARENISERIGFSSQKNSRWYAVAEEDQKLTIEEINELVFALPERTDHN
jgi:salicylate hydroxylase